MTGTAVATLPESGDASTWTPQEAALVEAAGLAKRQGPNTVLAPRPVVEAFLLHCKRTGLDPIARQIYCIERGGKWGTQVSIDGARLIAERSGEYGGQTAIEWTKDGVNWVGVWIPSIHGEHPEAARVGIIRKGFSEPVWAVATWDAYQAGGPMWRKMPALMLGKCAEMLGLRKAFPQELSGLYSAEEMDQAGQPKPAAAVADVGALTQPAPPAAPAPAAPVEQTPDAPATDWFEIAQGITFLGSKTEDDGGLRHFHRVVKAAGVLGQPIEPGSEVTLGDALLKMSAVLPESEPGGEDVVDAEVVDDQPMALAGQEAQSA